MKHKYKAWEKQNECMHDVSAINFKNELVIFSKPRNNIKGAGFDNVILLQYIGLKDSNDKEIYEGDIIRLYLSEDINTVMSVKDIREDYNYIKKLDKKNWEVLGNIYENPELLD